MKKEIKKKKLKCVQCGAKIGFNEEWTKEKAKDEYKKNYPFDENMETEYDPLCEDCYNEYMKWHNTLTPKEHEKIKEEIKRPSKDKSKSASLIRVKALYNIEMPKELKLEWETEEKDKKIRDDKNES